MAHLPQASSPQARIEDIEILRAVAILCVLVEHSVWNLVFDLPWLFRFLGHVPLWCGVDLFFVISGYVITRGLLRGLSQSRAGKILAAFWVRRIFRLWPAAWIWLGLIVLGSAIFQDPPFMGTLALNIKGATAGLFAFADLRFGLNGFGRPYGASFPFWSLSLEEQFYLLLPPLMLLAGRRLAPAALILILVQAPLAHNRVYFFLRTDGLLWGVLIAASPSLQAVARATAARARVLPGLGLIILAASIYAMSQASPPFEQSPPFWLGALALCAALPVWLASADRNIFHAGRLQPVFLWLGSRSYALYVAHMPVYQCAAALSHMSPFLAPILPDHPEWRSTLIGLPLLAAAAELTHRAVEAPLRRTGARLSAAFVREAA